MQIEIDKDDKEGVRVWDKMTFRPRLVGRLLGKRDEVVWREIDAKTAVANDVEKNQMSFDALKTKLFSLGK